MASAVSNALYLLRLDDEAAIWNHRMRKWCESHRYEVCNTEGLKATHFALGTEGVTGRQPQRCSFRVLPSFPDVTSRTARVAWEAPFLCFKMSIKNWLCVVHLSMHCELLSLDYQLSLSIELTSSIS